MLLSEAAAGLGAPVEMEMADMLEALGNGPSNVPLADTVACGMLTRAKEARALAEEKAREELVAAVAATVSSSSRTRMKHEDVQRLSSTLLQRIQSEHGTLDACALAEQVGALRL